jgi:hypothetical protein
LFAVVVALLAPPSVTVAPDPFAAGLMVPEMVYVVGGTADAVKFAPVTLAPLTVTSRLDGLNVNPLLAGVTVYEPLAKPVKL